MTWTSTPEGLYGESGIRTHGTLTSTHAFQACTFGHSVISPGPMSAGSRPPTERVGFEPTEPQAAQRFSRPPDSTALASLPKRYSEPKRIRTSDLWIRNPMLYPAELWAP